ncbi:MAG: hypothetical protein FJZ92_13655, partial [Chloroflexi bacterium]|nr:hypothetical protein [Chloroflexota bacterium]
PASPPRSASARAPRSPRRAGARARRRRARARSRAQPWKGSRWNLPKSGRRFSRNAFRPSWASAVV